MDVKMIHNLMDALKVAGCSFGEDLVPVLYNSLLQLQSENHFESVYFWGRIVTLSNDYYVAYGYQTDPINNRTFFYSQNILEWDIMPTDWPHYGTELVRRIKKKFNGNPRHVEISNKPSNRVHENVASKALLYDEEGVKEEDEQQHYGQMTQHNIMLDDIISTVTEAEGMEESEIIDDFTENNMIKEEDRLSISVRMIDNETHIVPRGFFYKLPDGNIVKTPYFKGLNYSEIGNENNFLHINPQFVRSNKGETDKLRSDYNGSIDFLESIDKDIPKGCWISRIVSNRYLIMHNLLWPGAVFMQDMNLGVHSFFYNGDGIKNLDLPFMI